MGALDFNANANLQLQLQLKEAFQALPTDPSLRDHKVHENRVKTQQQVKVTSEPYYEGISCATNTPLKVQGVLTPVSP